MTMTQKAIFDREQQRKDNKKGTSPKRQRPKGKSGMAVIMQLLEQQSES